MVLQALPVYSMSVFLLPKMLSKDIVSILSRFWWGVKNNKSKVHQVSWKKIRAHKKEKGLSFWDLDCLNKALLAKQLWHLLVQPHTLVAIILHKKYYPQGNFLNSKAKGHDSYLWKNLLKATEVINLRWRWRLGDGVYIKV